MRKTCPAAERGLIILYSCAYNNSDEKTFMIVSIKRNSFLLPNSLYFEVKNQHVSRVLCAKIENVVVVSVSEKQAHISESCQYNQPAQTNKRLLLLLLLLLLSLWSIDNLAFIVVVNVSFYPP